MQNTIESKNGWIGDCIVSLTICSQFINSVLCVITGSDEGYLSYIFIIKDVRREILQGQLSIRNFVNTITPGYGERSGGI